MRFAALVECGVKILPFAVRSSKKNKMGQILCVSPCRIVSTSVSNPASDHIVIYCSLSRLRPVHPANSAKLQSSRASYYYASNA